MKFITLITDCYTINMITKNTNPQIHLYYFLFLAAFINPSNKGAGRKGRDLNSGCA